MHRCESATGDMCPLQPEPPPASLTHPTPPGCLRAPALGAAIFDHIALSHLQ